MDRESCSVLAEDALELGLEVDSQVADELVGAVVGLVGSSGSDVAHVELVFVVEDRLVQLLLQLHHVLRVVQLA